MSQDRYLYIPVEIYRRELNGMLILSLVAAHNGWKVILGGKKEIFPYLNKLPEGVVLSKSIVPGEFENLKRIISEGFRIVSLDAEGLVLSAGEIGATLRYSRETVALADALFFWGQRQLGIVQQYFPEVKKVAHVTGSPVFDFWKYRRFENKKIERSMRKKKVLIATSFAYPNHVISEAMAEKLLVDTIQTNVAKQKYLDDFYADAKLQSLVYPKFKEFVDELIEKCPDVDFLLRPHVAESPTPWKKIGEKHKNVVMNLTGEISSVMVESDILIHFNSTTSIEANCFGKKVLTYIPPGVLPSELFDKLNQDTLRASVVCESVEQAVREINSFQPDSPETTKDFEDIIAGWNSPVIYNSSRKIVEALNVLPRVAATRKIPSRISLFANWTMMKRKTKMRILWILAWVDHFTSLFGGRYAPYRDYYRYGNTKQGDQDLNFGNLQELAAQMCRDFEFETSKINLKKIRQGMYLVSGETK